MSRKDIAAAIKSCNDRIRELESKPEWYSGKRQRKRAIQLERMKICLLYTSPSQRDPKTRRKPSCA